MIRKQKMCLEKNISISYKEYKDIDKFNLYEQELIEKSVQMAKNAYAPYSKFYVSSGILLRNHQMFFGTNVENASYPVGVCAERNVLSFVVSNFPNEKIETLTVYAESSIGELLSEPVSPCGMCRQALLEAENRQNSPIKIIMIGNGKFLEIKSCKELLPFSFDGSLL